ncbi:MAG: SDR family NAD(P)-dependent oxidoreductase [Pseudomonadota bacterium]
MTAGPEDQRHQRWRAKYGPWAVVTGASDGIGRAFATCLAARGIHLVLVARRRLELNHIAAEMAAQHKVETRVIDADLGQHAAYAGVFKATDDLDIGLLVACAGFGTTGRLIDRELDAELDMIEVNCSAVLAMSKHFGLRFARQGRGGLILMSSLLAFQGVPLAANYAATKAYVQTLAEGLRLELAPTGVDVLACAPGPIHSGFAARAGMVMGMAQKPSDIAGPALDALGRQTTVRPGWLAKSLEASFFGQPRRLRAGILGRVMRGMVRQEA